MIERKIAMSKVPSFRVESSLNQNQKAWVYQLNGKLIGSPDCYDFLELARNNISDETPHVALLVSGVTMLNSTGIGIIAALLTSTKNRNGKLGLVGAGDTTRRQLEVTHIWDFVKNSDELDGLVF